MLHHVGIEVTPAAIERTIELFQLLGFELVEPPQTLREFTWLERQGTQVHLMPSDSPTVPAPGHTALVAADFERTFTALAEHGFAVERRREHWGAPRALAITPDGHRVELMASSPAPPFIVVAGNIATGKSGFVRRLADYLATTPLLEEVSRNPYFDRFYEDPERWAFPSQVAFTVESLERHARAAADNGPVVQDRTVFEVVDVFGRLLRDLEHLSQDDFEVLAKFLSYAEGLRRQPSLLLHLHAPVSVIMERVARRGRPAEKHLRPDYLIELEGRYEDFVKRWTRCPVVEVDSSSIDLRDADQFASLVESLVAI